MGSKKILALDYLLCFLSSVVFAQQLQEIYIFGYVTDNISTEPVPGVLVEAIDESDSNCRSSTFTNHEGRYILNLTTSIEKDKEQLWLLYSYRLLQN